MKVALVSVYANQAAWKRISLHHGTGSGSNQATFFTQMGMEITIISLVDGVDQVRSQPMSELRKHWKSDKPELIHCYGYAALDSIADLAREQEIPVMVSLARSDLALVSAHNTLHRADRIVVTSGYQARQLVASGLPSQRIAIIPPGIDTEHFSPHGPTDRRTTGKKRILFAGEISSATGILALVAALADVPDVDLVIAGGSRLSEIHADSYSRTVRQLAHSYGVDDRIEWRGRVEHDRMPELIRSAEVVVWLPNRDTSGKIVIESMACGVPAIVSESGDLPEIVINGTTGICIPTVSPPAITAALHLLLSDLDHRQELGRAAMIRARHMHHGKSTNEKTGEIYHQLIRAQGHPTRTSA